MRSRELVERRLARALPIILLLLAGAALAVWLTVAAPSTRPAALTLWLALAAGAVAALPPIANRVVGLTRHIESLAPSTRRRVTIVIWVLATLYLAGTAWFQARDLFPRLHDEQSYTIGARMLARGRLWMPPHPLADFFESFHIFVRPVYASIYFPGTALMNVPGIWFGLPSWVVPVLAAGLVVALTYRVTAELVDDPAGILAALMVICVGRFRVLSTMVMAQVPAALLGLLLAWAWLHWRKDRRMGWALLIGAFAGWAAITRPVDAAAFAVPVGLAMLVDAISTRRLHPRGPGFPVGAMGKRTRLPVESDAGIKKHGQASTHAHGTHSRAYARSGRSFAALLAGAAPFLTLQLIFDLGVTGQPFKTPYVQYLEQNQPGSTFGSVPAAQAAQAPASALPQKQAYFYWLVQDEQARRQHGWRHWIGKRLELTCANGLPSVLFLAFLPVGLLGLVPQRLGSRPTPGRSGPGFPRPDGPENTWNRRWVMAAPAPLFFGLYLLNPFFLPHYPIPLVPPLAFLAALGVHVILPRAGGYQPKTSPKLTATSRLADMATASLLSVVVVLCIRSLHELHPEVTDEAYVLPTVTLAQGPLREAVHAPAVILFRYHLGLSPDDEPVYNSDVAWPDDAAVVRAHDLGQRNAELFRYYSGREPARRFYLFDRGDNALYDLGTAQQALRPEVLAGRFGEPIQKFGIDEPGR